MAAAVIGAMLVSPCSKLWYASAMASPGTPFSAREPWEVTQWVKIHEAKHAYAQDRCCSPFPGYSGRGGATDNT